MDSAAELSWWDGEDEPHEKGFRFAEHLAQVNGSYRVGLLHFLRCYSNRLAESLSGPSFVNSPVTGERIAVNVTKSAIDTAVAQIGANRPRPMFLTVRANYAERKRAERLGRFVKGCFELGGLDMKALQVFLKACINGTGYIHCYEENDRICYSVVPTHEILVDPTDAEHGEPTVRMRYKNVPLAWAVEKWPDFETELEGAQLLRFGEEESDVDKLGRQITILDLYRAGAEKGANGQRVICASSCTLEKTTPVFWSYVPFRYNVPLSGFYGIGAAEEANPIQMEINFLARKIQDAMTVAASFLMMAERGSNVTRTSNKAGARVDYSGRPPVFQALSPISGEFFNHFDRLRNMIYEIMGISQLQAQAKKPGGLDSGEALRVYNDIGTRRFQHTAQMWEQFYMDVTELTLDVAREHGNIKSLAAGDREVEEIDFKKVKLDKGRYVMRIRPVSIMPDEPAGKIETLRTLAQTTPELGPYLVGLMVNIPDLESAVAQINAPKEIVDLMIDGILEDGVIEPPYPEMNLKLARDMGTRALLQARIDNAPEANMAMLRDWITQVDTLVQAAAMAEAQAQMALQGGGMPGAPGQPPGQPVVAGTPAPAPLPGAPRAGPLLPNMPQPININMPSQS